MERDGIAEVEALERVFAALAHPSRRHILVFLHARGDRVNAGEIARRFSCSWPTTSRHVRVLERAGLLRVEKVGRERFYRLDRSRLAAVAGSWLARFGRDEPHRRRGRPTRRRGYLSRGSRGSSA